MDPTVPSARRSVGKGAGYDPAMPSKQTVPRSGSKNGSKARPARPKRPTTPEVKLGAIAANGISASMFGLIERGTAKRPRIAKGMRGTVELRFKEDFAPVRVTFGAAEVLIEDGSDDGERPDLVIRGSLPDIVQLTAAPLFGGLPTPTNARGRAALSRMAGGRVKIEGSPLLARRLMKLLEI